MLPPPSALSDPMKPWPKLVARTTMPRTIAMYFAIRYPATSLPVVTISRSMRSAPTRYGLASLASGIRGSYHGTAAGLRTTRMPSISPAGTAPNAEISCSPEYWLFDRLATSSHARDRSSFVVPAYRLWIDVVFGPGMTVATLTSLPVTMSANGIRIRKMKPAVPPLGVPAVSHWCAAASVIEHATSGDGWLEMPAKSADSAEYVR